MQQAPDEHPLLVPLQVRVMHPAVVEMALTNAEAAARATTTTTTTTTTTAGPPPGAMMFVATLNGGDTEPDDGSSSDDEDRREVVTFRPPHEAFHEDLHYLIGAVGGRERLISILPPNYDIRDAVHRVDGCRARTKYTYSHESRSNERS